MHARAQHILMKLRMRAYLVNLARNIALHVLMFPLAQSALIRSICLTTLAGMNVHQVPQPLVLEVQVARAKLAKTAIVPIVLTHPSVIFA
jgi:hypothetical protein